MANIYAKASIAEKGGTAIFKVKRLSNLNFI
jgi:hypothetical protein